MWVLISDNLFSKCFRVKHQQDSSLHSIKTQWSILGLLNGLLRWVNDVEVYNREHAECTRTTAGLSFVLCFGIVCER